MTPSRHAHGGVIRAAVALAGLGWALPAVARAAEASHAAADEAMPGLFAGDLGNVIWTLLIFGLVVWVLGRYAWGPLLSALQSREDFIRGSLDKAKADREEAEARLEQYDEKLAAARAEASEIVEEARRDAEAVQARLQEEAQQEAQATLERGKREIQLATEEAVRQLYVESGRLATGLASRILRREVRPEDHARLIRETLEQIGTEEKPS